MHPEGVGPPVIHGYPAALRAARTLKRRFWIVLAATALVTAAAVGLSLRQPALPLVVAGAAEVSEPRQRAHRHPEPVCDVPGPRAERADADAGRDVPGGRAAGRGARTGTRA